MINIMFWTLLYSPSVYNTASELDSTILLHPLSLAVLLVEWLFDSITFDYKHTFWVSLYLGPAYLPWSYFSNWFLGYYSYDFLTYQNIWSLVWIMVSLFLDLSSFSLLAYVTNKWKGGYLPQLAKPDIKTGIEKIIDFAKF